MSAPSSRRDFRRLERRARRRLRLPACRGAAPAAHRAALGKTLDIGEVDSLPRHQRRRLGDDLLGQGRSRHRALRIAIPQMAGEELGIGVERIAMLEGDTALTPDQGATAGSSGIMRGGVQIRQAAATARRGVDRACQRTRRQAGSRSRHHRRRSAGESRRRGHSPRRPRRRQALQPENGREGEAARSGDVSCGRASRSPGRTSRARSAVATSTSTTSLSTACCTGASCARRRWARRSSRSTKRRSRRFPACAWFGSRISSASSPPTNGMRSPRRDS